MSYTDYVIKGTWGSIGMFLTAISFFAGWQLYVRYTTSAVASKTELEQEDKD